MDYMNDRKKAAEEAAKKAAEKLDKTTEGVKGSGAKVVQDTKDFSGDARTHVGEKIDSAMKDKDSKSSIKVKKRSEDFDKAKLKASVKKAGAKDEHATKVADNVASKVKEGTATFEIRQWVITELRPLDSQAAVAYETYKKPAKKI